MKEHIDRLNAAQSHFDWATDPAEIDMAIYEIKAAEIAVSHYVEEKKKEEGFGQFAQI